MLARICLKSRSFFLFFFFFFFSEVATIFRCNRLDGCISRNRIFTDSLTGSKLLGFRLDGLNVLDRLDGLDKLDKLDTGTTD